MKKVRIIAVITMLLLAAGTNLVGCGGPAAQSGTGAPAAELPPSSVAESLPPLTGDPLLLAMREALLQSDGTTLSVDVWGGGVMDGTQRVDIDTALSELVADALARSDMEVMEGISGYKSQKDYPHIMMVRGGGQRVVLDLYRLDADYTEPAVDGTLLWLQVGEQTRHYLYAPEVFDTLLAAVTARLVPNTLSLEGEYVPVAKHPALPGEYYTHTLVSAVGGVALMHHWTADPAGYACALELIDPASGESLYFDQLPEASLLWQNMRLEACDYQGYDLRMLYGFGNIRYYDSTDPASQLDVTLPGVLVQLLQVPHAENAPYIRGFDADQAHDVWVAGDGERVTLVVGGVTTVLENTELTPELLGERYPAYADEKPEALPRLIEPRILNGGKTLMCCISLPSAQYPYEGVLLYDIPTGQRHWFPNLSPVLGGPMGKPVVLEDGRVLVEGGWEVRKLLEFELDGYTATERELPPADYDTALTGDYETWLYSKRERRPDGSMETVLYTDDETKPLFTVLSDGYGLAVDALDTRYVLCHTGGMVARVFALVQYN